MHVIDNTLRQKNISYWNKRAEGYSQVNRQELSTDQRIKWKSYIADKISEHYPDRKAHELKVLDIGTGPGFFSIITAELGFDVTAVDYSDEMLCQARSNAGSMAEKIKYIKMDAQNLEFDDETFDVIVTRNLTWNLPQPDKAYEQWCRVLKKGGLMLNFDANWYGYLYNEDMRRGYEQDRENVRRSDVKDEYTCTDIDAMEEIALAVPLSSIQRPQWDMNVLAVMCSSVNVDTGVWQKLWSDEEKLNFASTPLFSVQVVK